jgi:hypothetical protein
VAGRPLEDTPQPVLFHAEAESLFQDIRRLFEHEDLQANARHSRNTLPPNSPDAPQIKASSGSQQPGYWTPSI